jgi:hypothetical protein
MCIRNSGGSAYNDSASGGTSGLYYSSLNADNFGFDGGLFAGIATQSQSVQAAAVGSVANTSNYQLPYTDMANRGVVAYSPTGNMTTGTGTITVTLYYLTLTL